MMLSLATSLVVLVSIPFLIVVDHKAGTGYAVLPTSERVRRNSNVLHKTKSNGTRYKSSALPQQEISKRSFPFPPPFPPVTCQPLLAAEEEQDRPSTETSSLLSSGPGDIIDDDDDAASKKSTKSCIDITGLALLSKSEFWQLWVLMGLLTGVGLMTIKYVSSESCVSSSLISTATLVTMSRLSGNTGMTRSRTISSLIDNFGTSQ